MESEKRYRDENTGLKIWIGLLSLALVIVGGLCLYTLISFNNYKELVNTQFTNQHDITRNHSKEFDRQKRYLGVERARGGGAIYHHWGSGICPNSSSRVYAGEVASSWWNSSGGTNYLCVPDLFDMEWLAYNTLINASSYIFGTDYEVSLYGKSGSLFVNKNLNNKNVPCSVCQAGNRRSQLMIPAKTTCPDSSWTREYRGYLMTTGDGFKNQNEFICVDVLATGHLFNDGNFLLGAHLVHVKAWCKAGSGDIFTCLTGQHNREVACVVCSK